MLMVSVASALRLAAPIMRQQELKLATNMKGAPVWDLRVASADDVGEIRELLGNAYPTEVLLSLVAMGHSVVGESGGTVVSSALVACTGGKSPRGDLISVGAIPSAPAEIREKTALAALKKLKLGGFGEASCSISETDKDSLEFVTAVGFSKATASANAGLPAGFESYHANLMAMNPDPQKKIKD